MTMLRAGFLALLLLVAPAGCADTGGSNPQRPYEGLAFDISLVPEELRVPEPKDRRGIAPCALLTVAQLAELGLRTETAEEYPTGVGPGCRWLLANDSRNYATAIGSTDLQNPGLLGIYVIRDQLAHFEPLQIAGHPGVRADRTPRDGCEIAVAASDDQLIGANGNAAGLPIPDECGRSRRMVEMILSNLPPRR